MLDDEIIDDDYDDVNDDLGLDDGLDDDEVDPLDEYDDLTGDDDWSEYDDDADGEDGEEVTEPTDETGEPSDETGEEVTEPSDETGEPDDETGEEVAEPTDETGDPADETGEEATDPADETGEDSTDPAAPVDENGDPITEAPTGDTMLDTDTPTDPDLTTPTDSPITLPDVPQPDALALASAPAPMMAAAPAMAPMMAFAPMSAPVVPSASVYIKEDTSLTFENNEMENAIQQAVRAAVLHAAGQESADNTATVVVKDGTYAGGVNLDLSAGSELRNAVAGARDDLTAAELAELINKLRIRIAAEDAIAQDGTLTANSAGGVQVQGDITVNGRGMEEVSLAGLALQDGAQVTVTDVKHTNYYGTAQDDTVNLDVSEIKYGGSVTADMGDGDDTLDVQVSGKTASFDVAGADFDEGMDVTMMNAINTYLGKTIRPVVEANPINVTIKGGAGDDALRVSMMNASRAVTASEKIMLDVALINFAIDGGDGNDDILLTGGMRTPIANKLTHGVVGEVISLLRSAENVDPEAIADIALLGGAGDDVITLDISGFGLHMVYTPVFALDGGAGVDRLHLLGELRKDSYNNGIYQIPNGDLYLAAPWWNYGNKDGSKARTIVLPLANASIESYTDALLNKKTRTLTHPNGLNEIDPFYDYILDLEGADLVDFAAIYTVPEGGVMLSNLIVRGDRLDIKQLIAPGLNLLIDSPQVNIRGNIVGEHIQLGKAGGSITLGEGASLISTGNIHLKMPTINISGKLEGKSITLESASSIFIGQNATITAKGDLRMMAGTAAGARLRSTNDINILGNVIADSITLDALGSIAVGAGVSLTAEVGDIVMTGMAVTVGPEAVLTAAGDVQIIAPTIDIAGTLNAANITLMAFGSNDPITRDTVTIADNPLVDPAQTFVREDYTSAASITIGKDARLTATNGISLTAAASGLNSFDPDVQFILQSIFANIDIQGWLAAAFVTAGSSVQVNTSLQTGGLGVNMLHAAAQVTVGENAIITTPGDLTLQSWADIGLEALVPGDSLPVAMGAVGGSVNTGVLVRGQVAVGGNMEAMATSTATMTAKSMGATDAGAYIALTALAQHTSVVVDTAKDFYVTGSLKINSTAAQQVKTDATVPAITDAADSNDNAVRLVDAMDLLQKALDHVSGPADLLSSLRDMLQDAIRPAMANENDLSNQLVGALALAHTQNSNLARLNLRGTAAAGSVTVEAIAVTQNDVVADASLYQVAPPTGSVEPPKAALGVAIALLKGDHSNVADAFMQEMTAKGLMVNATSDAPQFHATANPGDMPFDAFGTAGAIAVNLSSVRTLAKADGGELTLAEGGALDVVAISDGGSYVADANFTAKTTARGAGIAVGVFGVEAKAIVGGTGSQWKVQGADYVRVAARAHGENKVLATSGDKGGTATVPALGLLTAGTRVEALLDIAPIVVPDGVIVSALGNMVHELHAIASPDTYMGTHAALAVIDDSAVATLNTSVIITGDGAMLDVNSQFNSILVQQAYVGDNGAPKDGIQAEALTGLGMDALVALAGRVGAGNVNADSVRALAAKRQKAETFEGSVGVAAALAVNVLRSTSHALVLDGLVLEVQKGAIDIKALGKVVANVAANGFVVKEPNGIGVAAATNRVFYDTLAQVGRSRLISPNVTIWAGEQGTSDNHSVSTEAYSGKGESDVGVAGAVAIGLVDGRTAARVADGTATDGAVIDAGETGTVTVNAQAHLIMGTSADATMSLATGIGPSTAITIVNTAVEALVGQYAKLTGHTIEVTAHEDHWIDTNAVAGRNDPASQIADAAVAVAVVNSRVHAVIGEHGVVTQHDPGWASVSTAQGGYSNVVANVWKPDGSLGNEMNQAAVGAVVGVNLAASDVYAAMKAGGHVENTLTVLASTVNLDTTTATGSTMGASLGRLGATLGLGARDGAIGAVQARIGALLGEKPGTDDRPLSSNVLGKTDMGAPDAPDMTEVNGAIAGSGQTATGQKAPGGQRFNAAAALALAAAAHKTTVELNPTELLSALVVDIIVEATNWAYAHASGEPADDAGAGNIAYAAALTITENEANALLGGTLDYVKNGADASLTAMVDVGQNITLPVAPPYGAYAVSGKLAAGAVQPGAAARMIGRDKAIITVLPGANIKSQNVELIAWDQSQYSAVADGVEVGVGASFAHVLAQGETAVHVGDGASITAEKLTIEAKKLAMSGSREPFPYEGEDIFTENGGGGIVNIDMPAGGINGSNKNTATVTIDPTNLGVQAMFDLPDLARVALNYYAAARSGTLPAGMAPDGALLGGYALLTLRSKVGVTLGQDVTIKVDGAAAGRDLTISATSEAAGRAVSGIPGENTRDAAGVNISAIYDTDDVFVEIGKDALSTIVAKDNIKITADASSDYRALGAAMEEGTEGLGGTIGYIKAGNKARVALSQAAITAGHMDENKQAHGELTIEAKNDSKLAVIAASGQAGVLSAPAAGGTVAGIVTGNSATVDMGSGVALTAADGLSARAKHNEQLLNLLASTSGAPEAAGVAGTIGVLITRSKAGVTGGEGNSFAAHSNGVRMEADNQSRLLNLMDGAKAPGIPVAPGAAVLVSVFDKETTVSLGEGSRVDATNDEGKGAGHNVVLQATGQDDALTLSAAGAKVDATGIAGAAPIIVGNSLVHATIGAGATINALDNIVMLANQQGTLANVATVCHDGTTGSAGQSTPTITLANDVKVNVGTGSQLSSCLGETGTVGYTLPGETEERYGVLLSATANTRPVLASQGADDTGMVNTFVDTSKVEATLDLGVIIRAGAKEKANGSDPINKDYRGEFLLNASDETDLLSHAGSISNNGSTGLGPAVVSTVYAKAIYAGVGRDGDSNRGTIAAARDISILAGAKDNIALYTLSRGAGVGASTQLLRNKVTALVSGTNYSGVSNMPPKVINVIANNEATLTNVALSEAWHVPVEVGPAPVGVVVYVESETYAIVAQRAALTDENAAANINVAANSKAYITNDVMGAALPGRNEGDPVPSISGAVVLVVSGVKTQTILQTSARIEGGAINISAKDDLKVLGAVGANAPDGTDGVLAVITVIRNDILTEIGADVYISARSLVGAGVSITADGHRDIRAYPQDSGEHEGIAATILTTVIGGKLTQDVADALAPYLDLDALMAAALSGRHVIVYNSRIWAADLEGDGALQAGTQIGSGNSFDAGTSDAGTNPSDDIKNAGNLGNPERPDDPARKDSTIVSVLPGAIVRSGADLNILATDNLVIDMITGMLDGANSYKAAGVGIAVAVMQGHVEASVGEGVSISSGSDGYGNVIARVQSVVNPASIPGAADLLGRLNIDELVKQINTKLGGVSAADKTIRVISLSGDGADTDAGAVSSVNMFTRVLGHFRGMAEGVQNLVVKAVVAYPQVLAATLGTGAGEAPNGAVAITLMNADVEAFVGGNAKLGHDKASYLSTDTVLVSTEVNALPTAVAMAIGGGTARNGALALSVNRMRINTFIGQGVTTVPGMVGAVQVLAKVNAHGTALLVPGLGANDANLSGAVAIMAPTVLTYVGRTPDGYTAHSAATGNPNLPETVFTAKSLIIETNGGTNVTAGDAVITGGVRPMLGRVALVFDNTLARTGLVDRSVTLTGDLAIRMALNTIGKAVLQAQDSPVGPSAAYVHMNGDARALLQLADGYVVNVENMTITALSVVIAEARATPSSGGSTEHNHITAVISTKALASIDNAGTLMVGGDLSMQAAGLYDVTATGGTAKMAAGAAIAGANKVNAYANPVQEARITQGSQQMHIGGDLVVHSSMNVKSTATTGGSLGATVDTPMDIEIAGAFDTDRSHSARAFSASQNKVTITGSGAIVAGLGIDIKATTVSEMLAAAKASLDDTLHSFGSLRAETKGGDKVDILIERVTLRASTGDISVYGKVESTVKTETTNPGGLSNNTDYNKSEALPEVDGQQMTITIGGPSMPGMTAAERQAVRALAAQLIAEVGDIYIRAENNAKSMPSLTATATKGYDAGLPEATVQSSFGIVTAVYVGEGSLLEGGDVSVKTKNLIHAIYAVEADTLGFDFKPEFVSPYVRGEMQTGIYIGGTLRARGNLTVQGTMDTKLALTADLQGDNVKQGQATTSAEVTRGLQIDILDTARLSAGGASLLVIASVGNADAIYLQTMVSARDVVMVNTELKLTSHADVLLHGGAELRAAAGTVTIKAEGGHAKAHIDTTVTSTNDTIGTTASAVLDVDVTASVKAMPTAAAVVIIGQNVNILSSIPKLSLLNGVSAISHKNGYDAAANSYNNISIVSEIDLAGMTIKASDKVVILANMPDGTIELAASAKGGSSNNSATATVTKLQMNGIMPYLRTLSSVVLGDDMHVYGMDVNVDATAYKRKITIVADNVPTDAYTFGRKLDLYADGTYFYIGHGAGGVHIDLSTDADGNLVVDQVGLPGGTGPIASVVDGKIVVEAIRVAAGGKLHIGELTDATGGALSNIYIAGQHFLDEVTITNRTGMDMVLRGIIMRKTGGDPFNIVVDGGNYALHFTTGMNDDGPTVDIESQQATNVELFGDINNKIGAVSLLWTGTPGSLLSTGGVLHAHRLTISGVLDIGTATGHLVAYLYGKEVSGQLKMQDPSVNIDAAGDVRLYFTPSEITFFNANEIPATVPTIPLATQLLLEHISAGGLLSIQMGLGYRRYEDMAGKFAYANVTGSTTALGDMQAGTDLILYLRDGAGKLIDARPAGATAPNLRAGGNLYLTAPKGTNAIGSFGTQAKPLDIAVGGKLYLWHAANSVGFDRVAELHTYLRAAEGNITVGDTTVADGVTVVLTAEDGSIYIGTLALDGASTSLTLDASADILADENAALTSRAVSQLTLLAGGDIGTAAKPIGINLPMSLQLNKVHNYFLQGVATTPRLLNITLGTDVTGAAWVQNTGNIIITRATGDVLLDSVVSDQGRVDITATAGRILAAEAREPGDAAHLSGKDVDLSASGDIGELGKALLVSGKVTITKAGSYYLLGTGEELKITATEETGAAWVHNDGDISLHRGGGNALIVRSIDAGTGDVTIDAYSIEGTGNATHVKGAGIVLTATGDIGTATAALVVDPGQAGIGIMSAGNYYLQGVGNALNINANSSTGTAWVHNDGDISLAKGGALTVDSVDAGNTGTATITAASIQGTGATPHVKGAAIVLEATGNIGAVGNALVVDTTGTVTVQSATNYYLQGVGDDLTVKDTTTNGTAWVHNTGDIDLTKEGPAALIVGEVDAGGTATIKGSSIAASGSRTGAQTPHVAAAAIVLETTGAIGSENAALLVSGPVTITSAGDYHLRGVNGADLTIVAQSETGLGHVYNEESITVTQEDGTLNVGIIQSSGGDVSLTAQDGGISGGAVRANSATLSATGDIGAQGTPLHVPDAVIINGAGDYYLVGTNLSIDVTNPTGTANVAATENITLTQQTGDLTVGVIYADGNATLTAADGNITGFRVEAENATLSAGGTIGTEDIALMLNVRDKVTITAAGDYYLQGATGTGLIIDVTKATGTANVEADGDITLTQQAGDLDVGTIKSEGKATLAASNGAISGGSVTAASIVLSATGDIGAENAALTVSGPVTITGAGDYYLKGASLTIDVTDLTGTANVTATGDITLTQQVGDLTVGTIKSGGDTTLTARDSIYGGSVEAASITLTATDNIGAMGAALQVSGPVTITGASDYYLKGADLIIDVTTSTGTANVEATGDITLTQQDGDLNVGTIQSDGNTTLTAQEGAITGGTVEAKSITLSAKGDIGATNAALTVSGPVTITGAGNYYLTGADLTIDVTTSTGTANVEATGDIDLTQQDGDLNVGTIQSAGSTTLTASNGNITGGTVEADSITLTASGNIGEKGAALQVTGPVTITGAGNYYLTGTDLTIDVTETTGTANVEATGDIDLTQQTGNLNIDAIQSAGSTTLTARNGNITGGSVEADSITLTASGNIGAKGADLTVTGPVTITGAGNYYLKGADLTIEVTKPTGTANVEATGDIDLTQQTGDLDVGIIQSAGNTTLTAADGAITGGSVEADSITLSAKTDIGAKNAALTVTGPVTITGASDYYLKGADLTINVTNPTGTANVEATGDVTLTQQTGDLTVGIIQSVGDTTLTATNGAITGGTVQAANARLTATGTIGAANAALLINVPGTLTIGSAADYFLQGAPGTTLTIVVEQGAGNATVTNDGDIYITQETDDLLADAIHSGRGNVTLTALDGSILAVLRRTRAITPNAEGKVITLNATGDVGATNNWFIIQQKLSGDLSAATLLHTNVDGNIYIRELTGNLGLGNLIVGGNANITAPGSILDTRTDKTDANLAVGGNTYITSESGTLGTRGAYLDTLSDGTIFATSEGEISILGRGTLRLVANSRTGQTNATAGQDAIVTNDMQNGFNDNFLIGAIVAGNTANITAKGVFTFGDRLGQLAPVNGRNVSITALGGPVWGPGGGYFEVNTTGGWLSAYGTDIRIHDLSTDGFAINEIITAGNVLLLGKGDITAERNDTGEAALQAARDAALAAREAADEARRAYEWQQRYLVNGRLEEDYGLEAEKALLDAAKAALDAVNAEIVTKNEELAELIANNGDPELIEALRAQIKELTDALPGLQDTKDEAQRVYDEAALAVNTQWEHDQVPILKVAMEAAEALALQKEAILAQLLAQANQQQTDITAGGTLTIETDGIIGRADQPITIAVGGPVRLNTGATTGTTVGLYVRGNAVIDDIRAGDTAIIATGSIQALNPQSHVITGDSATLDANGGNVGSESSPLRLHVGKLSGTGSGGFYVDNNRAATIGRIIADETILAIAGDILTDGRGTANIITGSLVINTPGDVGKDGSRLIISTDTLLLNARNLHLINRSDDLVLIGVTTPGGTVKIFASGRIISGQEKGESVVFGHDIRLIAQGDIGEPDKYLIVTAGGNFYAYSIKGHVYGDKIVPPTPDPDPNDKDTDDGTDDDDLKYRIIRHDPTGTTAGAYFDDSTTLHAGPLTPCNCPPCIEILRASRGDDFIVGYDLWLQGDADILYEGTITVTLQVGKEWNGRTVTVMHCDDGELVILRLVVRDGAVTYTTSKLGKVAVLGKRTGHAGYLNLRLTEQIDITPAQLSAMEISYRMAQMRRFPQETRLLHADTGTTLWMPAQEDDLQSRLMADTVPVGDARLDTLLPALDAGETILEAVALSIADGPDTHGPDGTQLPDTATLGLRLHGLNGKPVTLWQQDADGDWFGTVLTVKDGDIGLDVTQLGLYVVTL